MGASLIPLAVAGVSGLGSMIGAGMQQQSSARMAREQMQFQERMSSTAHQREVEDLRRAGLNPILSANTGASSPGGAMGVAQNPVGAGVSSAMSTYMAMQQNRADLAVKAAQANASSAQALKTQAETPQKGLLGGISSDALQLYRAGQDKVRDWIEFGKSYYQSHADKYGTEERARQHRQLMKESPFSPKRSNWRDNLLGEN